MGKIAYMFVREVVRGFSWEIVKFGMRLIRSAVDKIKAWFKGEEKKNGDQYSTPGNYRVSAGKVS